MDNDDRNNPKKSVDELGCNMPLPGSTDMGNDGDRSGCKIHLDELGYKILPPDSLNATEEITFTSFTYTNRKSDGSFSKIKIIRHGNKKVWGLWALILGAVLALLSIILVYLSKPALIGLF